MWFDPILVISRPKKSGLGTHFGVQFPDGTVYDYVAGQDLRRVSRERFADGEIVTKVREIPWHMAGVVRERLRELGRNPRKYDLLQWNCETFAEWLTSGVPRSAQVIGVVVLVGAIVALVIASRS